jgi:hypothetical protein
MFNASFLYASLLVCASSITYASDGTSTTTTSSTYITTTANNTYTTTNTTTTISLTPEIKMRDYCPVNSCFFGKKKEGSVTIETLNYPPRDEWAYGFNDFGEQFIDFNERFIFGTDDIPYSCMHLIAQKAMYIAETLRKDYENVSLQTKFDPNGWETSSNIYVMKKDYIPLRDKAILYFQKKKIECDARLANIEQDKKIYNDVEHLYWDLYCDEEKTPQDIAFLERLKARTSYDHITIFYEAKKMKCSESILKAIKSSRNQEEERLRSVEVSLLENIMYLQMLQTCTYEKCPGAITVRQALMLTLQVKAVQEKLYVYS